MKMKTIFITLKAEMTEKFKDYTTIEKYFDPYPTVPNEKGSQLCYLFRPIVTTIKRNLLFVRYFFKVAFVKRISLRH